MLKKSKRLFSVFIVALSLIFSMSMFSGCKKDKDDKQETPAPAIVVATALTTDMINLEYSSIVYSGAENKPAVVVKIGESIVSDSEYDVDYFNVKNAGTASVEVKAKEGSQIVSGSASKTFEIIAADVLPYADYQSVFYNGQPQVPDVYINSLISGTDYQVSWKYRELGKESEFVYLDRTINNFVEVGEYQLVINGINNYKGTQTATYKIYEHLAQINAISSADFNGENQIPSIEIDGLEKDKDYVLSYKFKANGADNFVDLDTSSNNFKNAGDYQIVARGIGKCSGEQTAIYTINPIEMGEIEITEQNDYLFETSQVPVYGIDGLVQDIDYVVSWNYKEIQENESRYKALNISENNFKNAGCYKLVITGKGNYTGTKEAVYTINRIYLPNFRISKADYIYNDDITIAEAVNSYGADVTYKITSVEADKNNLEAASWKTYSNHKELDAGTYFIYGIAGQTTNYYQTNSAVSTFVVEQDDLPNLPSTLGEFVYDGTSKKPTINLTVNGKTLIEGENSYDTDADYFIIWEYVGYGNAEEFKSPGRYIARLNYYGTGNYKIGSSTTVTESSFIVTKCEFADIEMKLSNTTYTKAPGFEDISFEVKSSDTKYDNFTIDFINGNFVCSEGGTITIYYNTHPYIAAGGWIEFKEDTTLAVGKYYMYAEIKGCINCYNQQTTVAVLTILAE